MNKFKNFWVWFKTSLKDSSWFSAYIQLLFLIVTTYALFLTNITETVVSSLSAEAVTLKLEVKKINQDIQNLSTERKKIIEDKTLAEEEIEKLTKIKKEYISNISEVVINNIITELNKRYQDNLLLNKQLAKMQDFENWISKWSKKEAVTIDSNLSDSERRKHYRQLMAQKNDEEPEVFSFDIRTVELNWLKRNRCIDCDVKGELVEELTIDDVFNQKKMSFLRKNDEYGYNVLNSVSITLLPDTDKVKLQQFLNNYSKKTKYQKPIYFLIEKWDYDKIKTNSIKAQQNISDLENDLPNLSNELKIFISKL